MPTLPRSFSSVLWKQSRDQCGCRRMIKASAKSRNDEAGDRRCVIRRKGETDKTGGVDGQSDGEQVFSDSRDLARIPMK